MTNVKRLMDEATTGPWITQHVPDKAYSGDWYIWGAPSAVSVGDVINEADARLIVHAVNALPDYEAAVNALERLIVAAAYYSAYVAPFEQAVGAPSLDDAVADSRAALRRLREGVPA